METALASKPKIHKLPKLPPAPAPRKPLPVGRFAFLLLVPALAFGALSLSLHFPLATGKAGLPQETRLSTGFALAQAAPSAGDSQTIVLGNGSNKIVGRMAKIPAQTEQITEIKSVSDIDNNAGRELLSILSKY